MARLVVDTASAAPLEAALVDLARKSVDAPARLVPDDLVPLRALAGDGALDYVLVLASFHFINRIADLLAVDPEVPLPAWLRRVEPVRRLVVRMMAVLLGRMDLRNRRYAQSLEQTLVLLPPGTPTAGLEQLRARPKVVEAIAGALDERDRSSLDRTTLARVHATVEAALPATADDAHGFHPRPPDPVEAFAFVGTRYAYRVTPAMIEALRRTGFDDLGLLDLAIAVADANQWARMHRLLGLDRAIFALSPAP